MHGNNLIVCCLCLLPCTAIATDDIIGKKIGNMQCGTIAVDSCQTPHVFSGSKLWRCNQPSKNKSANQQEIYNVRKVMLPCVLPANTCPMPCIVCFICCYSQAQNCQSNVHDTSPAAVNYHSVTFLHQCLVGSGFHRKIVVVFLHVSLLSYMCYWYEQFSTILLSRPLRDAFQFAVSSLNLNSVVLTALFSTCPL